MLRPGGKAVLIAGGLVAVVGAATVVAWAAESGNDDRVARNVTLAGERVGGLSRPQLVGAVNRVASRYAGAAVVVEAPGGGFRTDSPALGLAVDEDATVGATMAVGRGGSLPGRIRGWVGSFFRPRAAPVRVTLDEVSVYRVVAARDPGPRIPPREPTIRAVRGRVEPVEGKPGRGIDAAHVIERLPRAARRGIPVVVRVDRGPVAPRFSLDDAAALARQAEALTANGLDVRAGSQEATVPAGDLRSWLRSEPTDTGLQLTVDPKAAAAGLSRLLPRPDTPAKEASFTVVGGAVRLVPGVAGTACCAPEAGEVIEQALRDRPGGARRSLPLKKVDPRRTTEEAAALGIKQQVATFTTAHKPNEPRVRNIHRIADLVRGHIIEPGATFSINDVVGPRTAAKGFVVDAVIQDGKFEESVGGGISQFATTTFNAAFLAGLDFVEYQSHSIYIPRYPFGREATLSYPHPDLKIRNPSPYGVLVWPSYTGTTITVSLYSTRWADVSQTGQTTEPRGPCTRVRTQRTRRFLVDGTTKVDHVAALYRPAEGIACP